MLRSHTRFLCLLATTVATAVVAQEPTLAQVLQQHAEACGGRQAWSAAGDYMLDATVHSQPIVRRRTFVRRSPFALRMESTREGDSTTTVDLCDGRLAFRLQPDGQLAWLRGEEARHLLEVALVDGRRYLEEPAAGMRIFRGPSQALAMPPGLPDSLRQTTPVWPVAVALACGTEVRLYFDAGDGRLRGLANTSFQPQRNVRFGDWHAFDSVRLPASRWENRGAAPSVRVQIDRVRFGPLDAALFAAMPTQSTAAPVDVSPLLFVATEVPGACYLLVPAVGIDRRTQVTALFDTGAGRTYLDDRLADALQLDVLSQRPVRGIVSGTSTTQRWLEALELPGYGMHQLEVGATRLPLTIQDADGGWPSVVLGGELLHLGPVFDRTRGRLLLRGPKPEPMDGTTTITVPLVGDADQDLEELVVTIDGVPLRAVLDSGMPVALRLRPSGLRAANLPTEASPWLARGAVPLQTTGAGDGHTTDLLIRLESFQLGPVTFERPWVQIGLSDRDDTGGITHQASVGAAALACFRRVGLDRRGRRLELEPGGDLVASGDGWRAPAPAAFLGLRLYEPDPVARQRGQKHPAVAEVCPGSAAAAAGIARGDLLRTIDGTSCEVPLPRDWRQRLWARGPVTLEIERAGTVRRVVLTP